jgi:hypothetical protein
MEEVELGFSDHGGRGVNERMDGWMDVDPIDR